MSLSLSRQSYDRHNYCCLRKLGFLISRALKHFNPTWLLTLLQGTGQMGLLWSSLPFSSLPFTSVEAMMSSSFQNSTLAFFSQGLSSSLCSGTTFSQNELKIKYHLSLFHGMVISPYLQTDPQHINQILYVYFYFSF